MTGITENSRNSTALSPLFRILFLLFLTLTISGLQKTPAVAQSRVSSDDGFNSDLRSFQEADRIFIKGAAGINMNRVLFATNGPREMKKFIRSLNSLDSKLQPEFIFHSARPALRYARVNIAMSRALRALPAPDSSLSLVLRQLYRRRIHGTVRRATFLARWSLLQTGETAALVKDEPLLWPDIYSLFPEIDPALKSRAEEWLSEMKKADLQAESETPGEEPRNGDLDSRAMGRKITEIYRLLGIRGARVAFRDTMASRISVSPISKKVSIRKNARFSPMAVRRLAVHEIGVHMTRAANGSRMLPGLRVLTQGSDPVTEEGLAKYMERFMGVNQTDRDYRFLLLYLGALRGKELTFRELFLWVRENLSPFMKKASLDREAFNMTMRLRRGLALGATPGVYPKDAAYFQGYSTLLQELGNPDSPTVSQENLDLLLTGKWSLEELPMAAGLFRELPRNLRENLINSEKIREMLRSL